MAAIKQLLNIQADHHTNECRDQIPDSSKNTGYLSSTLHLTDGCVPCKGIIFILLVYCSLLHVQRCPAVPSQCCTAVHCIVCGALQQLDGDVSEFILQTTFWFSPWADSLTYASKKYVLIRKSAQRLFGMCLKMPLEYNLILLLWLCGFPAVLSCMEIFSSPLWSVCTISALDGTGTVCIRG